MKKRKKRRAPQCSACGKLGHTKRRHANCKTCSGLGYIEYMTTGWPLDCPDCNGGRMREDGSTA